MRLKKFAVGIMAFALIAPVSLTGCVERTETEETVIDRDVDPAPVIVPDRDVDVNVQTETKQAPDVIHHDTTTNTTTERNTDTGTQSTTETKTETVH